MTVFCEFKVKEGDDPVFERYADVKTCSYYFAHGNIYLKLYKNNSKFQYDFCIDMSDVKAILFDD